MKVKDSSKKMQRSVKWQVQLFLVSGDSGSGGASGCALVISIGSISKIAAKFLIILLPKTE